MKAWFYILRLRSGTLYTGATKNLRERHKAHLAGKACRTTKLDPPIKLVYSESFPAFSDARKREAQVKKWSRAKKEALVSGDMQKLRELSKSRKLRWVYPELGLGVYPEFNRRVFPEFNRRVFPFVFSSFYPNRRTGTLKSVRLFFYPPSVLEDCFKQWPILPKTKALSIHYRAEIKDLTKRCCLDKITNKS